MATREATLRVDFSKVPVKPSVRDTMEFISSKLQLKPDDVSRIHLRTSSANAFIEIKDQSLALKIVEEHDEKHSIECQGTLYPIPIHMDDGSVLVKLHDLSPRVTDIEIAKFFAKYGKVLNITEGKWAETFQFAGLPNGYRFVRLVLAKPIPSFIEINGEATMATYRGQKPTCKYCEQHVHHGITCKRNRHLVSQKPSVNNRLRADSSTYAETVAKKTSGEAATGEIAKPPASRVCNAPAIQPTPIPKPRRAESQSPTTSYKTLSSRRSSPPSTMKNNNEPRSTSAKRQAEIKITDNVIIESKRGRTRYVSRPSEGDLTVRGRQNKSK